MWSLTSKQEHMLRAFDTRVLRVFEIRVLRVFENRVMRVFENRVMRVFENRVMRVFEIRVMRVFENRVLRKISGPKSEEVTEDWGENPRTVRSFMMCCSSHTARVIKSRRIRFVGQVALLEEEKRLGNLKERDQLEDQGTDGSILTIIIMMMMKIIRINGP
jgi:glycine cleavage system aminomethyltransferase T